MEGFEEFSLELQPGVYVLYHKDEIVYIGKASHLPSRIHTHYSGNKIRFDRVMVRYCAVSEIDGLEARLIRKYKPKHNAKDLGYTDMVMDIDLAALGLRCS